jgi:hypothetical protein
VWLAEITAKTGSPSPEVNSICSLESVTPSLFVGHTFGCLAKVFFQVSSICAACGDGTIQMYDIDTGSEKVCLQY